MRLLDLNLIAEPARSQALRHLVTAGLRSTDQEFLTRDGRDPYDTLAYYVWASEIVVLILDDDLPVGIIGMRRWGEWGGVSHGELWAASHPTLAHPSPPLLDLIAPLMEFIAKRAPALWAWRADSDPPGSLARLGHVEGLRLMGPEPLLGSPGYWEWFKHEHLAWALPEATPYEEPTWPT